MSAPTSPWVGLQLEQGRYRVERPLGAGGMGQVYLAQDTKLNTDVVLKVPHRSLLENPQAAARFRREIRGLVKLAHKNIVKVQDIGEHDGLPFLVMQYLPGGSLYDRLRHNGDDRGLPMPPEDLTSWLPAMAEALDFIHAQGYVHRDVKPHNILFDTGGQAYLGDFGLIKAMTDDPSTDRTGQVTGTGQMLGTAWYMAPELCEARGFDGRVDQYALAATVYQWVCGRPPFEGPLAAVLVQQVTQPPPSPRNWVAALPEAVGAALLKGLAKDPKQRFASCAELADAVLAALSRPASSPQSSKNPPKTPARGKEPKDDAPMVKASCPKCGKVYRMRAPLRPGTVSCKNCGASIAVRPNGPTLPETLPDKTRHTASVPAGRAITAAKPRPQTVSKKGAGRLRILGLAFIGLLVLLGGAWLATEGKWLPDLFRFPTRTEVAAGGTSTGENGEPTGIGPSASSPQQTRPITKLGKEEDFQLAADLRAYQQAHLKSSTRDFLRQVAAKRLAAWRQAAERGDPRGQLFYGDCCKDGIGLVKDEPEAARWYRQAADQGLAEAQHHLGACYREGTGVGKDEPESIRWYRLATTQGLASAQYSLGYGYKHGLGVTKDEKEAVVWIRKAADQNHMHAQNNLGICYEKGTGVAKDEKEAVAWYRKAADLGFSSAQYNLGACYHFGRGLTRDDKQAVAWYRKAADQDHARAQNGLGHHYERGWGVAKDEKQAVAWYRKAADLDSALAQNNLGNCYRLGRGVTKDEKQAVAWYRKAGDQNLARAQNNLGFCYEQGIGVAKNVKEAIVWYRKAADQGEDVDEKSSALAALKRLGVNP